MNFPAIYRLARCALSVLTVTLTLSAPSAWSQPVVKIATGGDGQNLELRADGTVWAWGYNAYGQLGDGSTTTRSAPVPVLGLTGVVDIAVGGVHSLARKQDGTVWTWGRNDVGQLGDGSTAGRSVPTLVPGLTGVVEIAAGGGHSLARKQDGTVWAWGDNSYGQIGVGSPSNLSPPVRVLGLTGAVEIAAGSDHSLARKPDGSVWAWGNNYQGQLGDGSTTFTRSTPVLVSGLTGAAGIAAGSGHSLARKQDGTLWTWGGNYNSQLGDGSTTFSRSTPVLVPGLTGVAEIAAGGDRSFARTQNGKVWTWGFNANFQGNTTAKPVEVVWLGTAIQRLVSGRDHALALTTDGHVMAWGKNSFGQLGIPGPQDSSIPKQVLDVMLPSNTQGAYPVVEYHNKAIAGGRYFITAQSEEIKALDGLGTGGGFSRTGRAWRAWQTPNAIPAGVAAKPVYRFYVPGPNSHFYTVFESERDLLINYNAGLATKVHDFEGPKFYALGPVTGANGVKSCAAGSYPVYRAFNNKTSTNQGNHRITSNWIDIFRGVRFLGWTNEGIAFCSPISTINGGDLQAYHTYPGDSVAAGNKMTAECVFNNAGPGNANGATIYCALPPQANWTLTCSAQNGATCPPIGNSSINADGTLTPDNIRLGIDTTSFPAGGIITLTATATAPTTSDVLLFASAIQQPSGAPDPLPTNNISSGLSKTVVKKVNDCIVSLSADSLSLTASNTQPNQLSLKAPTGCAWTLALDAPAATMLKSQLVSGGGYTPSQLKAGIINANRLSGIGDAIIELRANANATTNVNTGQITATATSAATSRANRTATLTVVQAATPTTDTGCSTLQLNRESEWQGDNIISGNVSVLASTNSCTWTAASDAPWLIIMQGASSKGTGSVQYQIQANATSSEQKANITVKGSNNSTPVTLTINQAASTTNLVRSGGAEGGEGDGGGDGGGSGGGGEGAGGAYAFVSKCCRRR